MKRLLVVGLALLVFASVAYAATFKCYRYVDGKPTGGHINVEASSKSEAESKAYAEYKKLGYKVDSCECSY